MTQKYAISEHQRSILLGAVLEFMKQCGTEEALIRESFEKALAQLRGRKASERFQHRDGIRVQTQNLPALLLRAWHRDARYIDTEAKPLPLPLTQGRNSLSSVIKRIDPSAKAMEVLRSMRAVGLIRRTSRGRYVPTSEAAIVHELHPLLIEHVTKLVSRLISTISRNTRPGRGCLSLVDRHAYTAELNPTDRVAFAEFTRSQGMAYLESIDDWLAQRQVRHGSVSKRTKNQGLAAGVYLFAYLGDGDAISSRTPQISTPRPKRSTNKKSSTPRPKRSSPPREAHA